MSDELLLENIKLPTSLSRDVTGLQKIASDIRAQMADPNSPIYGGRPDLIAAAEKNLRALEIRAGATVAPMTAERLAAKQHEQHWDVPSNPAFEAMLTARTAELDSLGSEKLEARADTLRAELGPATYDTLLDLAKVALGTAVPAAARADLGLLRVLAGEGRFKLARARATRP